MSEFKRSHSKVWWASESVEWREVSQSPGSQDSGFSDSETSPRIHVKEGDDEHQSPPKTPVQRIQQEIFKDLSSGEKPQNLSANYKEKITPSKSLKALTPESPRKSRFSKNSPKVIRSLFGSARQKEFVKDVADGHVHHQYSQDANQNKSHATSVGSEASSAGSCANQSAVGSFQELSSFKSLPLAPVHSRVISSPRLNRSAPAVLGEVPRDELEDVSFTGNHSLSSDCESELECLFNGGLESPPHTSTPKAGSLSKMRRRRNKIPFNLYPKYQQERLPLTPETIENGAVQLWVKDMRQLYEQECMTTLQCKSIAGELNQKVSLMANLSTLTLRNILSHSQCIENEYRHLNSEQKHIKPLAQSLAGNIMDFLKTYKVDASSTLNPHLDGIRKSDTGDSLKLVSDLFTLWQGLFHDILVKEVKKLSDRMEHPCSELDLRATVTGITFVCLRNDDLIDLFIKSDVVPILLIFSEKCEGSSLRSLLLRALATICCNNFAVRQFEKYSGIQLVTDTLEEESRPEPERSEAVALLAQVTAPWIEDNHSIRGLQDYSKKLVKSLTKFVSNTKCCQNLLLCAAALANLSSMDSKCIKYMLHQNTIQVLLAMVTKRGPLASVYLLEQVATLVANMSAAEAARKQLTAVRAPAALLHFLKLNTADGDVEKRLQQKSIIALSRLCSEREAANQVVQLGGVEKLVKMCREKSDRFDSDAVLVATLATLRKIADTCGPEVISAEDSQELVEPKLLDSFLAYSTQSESYV